MLSFTEGLFAISWALQLLEVYPLIRLHNNQRLGLRLQPQVPFSQFTMFGLSLLLK